jgi:hypothetical protein
MRRLTQIRSSGWFMMVLWLVLGAPLTYAQTSSSSHYQVNEVQFGTGGNVESTSNNYNAQSSLGSLGGGQSSSSSFTANAGFLTQNEPYLEMGVISGDIDLGLLSPTATRSGSGSFYVRTYTSGGYVIVNLGTPPTSEANHALTSKTTVGIPIIGTEEFGMNLVKNTNFCGAGCHLGDDPVPIPDATYATGTAATGYNTTGQFKFNQGDTIATAPNGNGQTNYTVSIIANISSITPAGRYTARADFAVVASY